MLLTRDQFREGVFKRDFYQCVVPGCEEIAKDAHHIIERQLWQDKDEFGGYFLSNGVSLCGTHHWHAERDFFPPQACRNWAGITERILPKSLTEDFWYSTYFTKWGVEIQAPSRIEIKYPTTLYLPFSPSIDNTTDRGVTVTENLIDKPLVISIKMDGSNCFLTKDRVAARNGDTAIHPSFSMLKSLHAEIKYAIPGDLQLFGEWLYAKHSIHYKDLRSYLQIFGAYRPSQQLWLSWDEMNEIVQVIGDSRVQTVPVIASVACNETWELIRFLTKVSEGVIADGHEGIVVRSAYPFHYGQFSNNVAKYVRANHVQTDKHWSTAPIIRNLRAEES